MLATKLIVGVIFEAFEIHQEISSEDKSSGMGIDFLPHPVILNNKRIVLMAPSGLSVEYFLHISIMPRSFFL